MYRTAITHINFLLLPYIYIYMTIRFDLRRGFDHERIVLHVHDFRGVCS